MTTWSPSLDLVLSPSDDPRVQTRRPCDRVDHAAAVQKVKSAIGLFTRAAIIRFHARKASISYDRTWGRYGYRKYLKFTISVEELYLEPAAIAWSRSGNVAWERNIKPTIKEPLQQIVNVIKDSMVHGYIELARIHRHAHWAPILAKALVEMPLFLLKMHSTVVTKPVADMLTQVLSCSGTLDTLDLSGCSFSTQGIVDSFCRISELMKRSKLRRLYFSLRLLKDGDKAGMTLLLAINKGLVNHPSLEHLHIENVSCTSHEDRMTVERLLAADGCQLKRLEVSFCTDEFINTVIKALPNNKSLKTLDLGCHGHEKNLTPEQMKNLAGALRVNIGIEEVVLKNISEEAVIAFASELPTLLGLRKLDVQGPSCTAEAADSLRKSLEKGVCNLQSLKFQFEQSVGPRCSPPLFYYACSDNCVKAIEFQLTLNKHVKPFTGRNHGRIPASIWPVVLGRVQGMTSPKTDDGVCYNWADCLPSSRLPFVSEKAKNHPDFETELAKKLLDNPHKAPKLTCTRFAPPRPPPPQSDFSNDITFALLKSGVVPLTGQKDKAM